MYLEFKFEIVVKKTVWEKTTHKNGSNRYMKKTFFFIFHLPRPKWTCLSVLHIVPVTFIENHWSLIHMFLGLQDPVPDPLVRGMDPDPSIIKQK